VLEVDGDVVEFDETRLGLHTSSNLRAIVGDGRMTMHGIASDSADVVVGDAYSGHAVPWHLTTTEWLEEVKRVLRPGGIYVMNLIDLKPLEFFKAESATMLQSFADMRFIGFVYKGGEPAGGNIILVASDQRLPDSVRSYTDHAYTYLRPEIEELAAGAEALTDDYAPVDQLRTFE
jgi:spermidine synthase